MTRRPFRLPDAIALVGGVAGVVVAHALDYAIVFPDPASRRSQLLATGHGYWATAGLAASLSAVLAAGAAVVRGVQAGRAGRVADARPKLPLLVGFQMTLFALVEVCERVHAGISPAGLLHERTFRFGLAVQVVVAVAVAGGLFVFDRIGRRTGSALARRTRTVERPRTWSERPNPSPPRSAAVRAARSRAPPVAA